MGFWLLETLLHLQLPCRVDQDHGLNLLATSDQGRAAQVGRDTHRKFLTVLEAQKGQEMVLWAKWTIPHTQPTAVTPHTLSAAL